MQLILNTKSDHLNISTQNIYGLHRRPPGPCHPEPHKKYLGGIEDGNRIFLLVIYNLCFHHIRHLFIQVTDLTAAHPKSNQDDKSYRDFKFKYTKQSINQTIFEPKKR